MVPTHLGSLRLRVASTQARIQIHDEKHTETIMLTNSESFLTENKIQ